MAALAQAQAAGVAIALQPDGRLTWASSQLLNPDLLRELRANRNDIRAGLIAQSTNLPADLLERAWSLGWRIEDRPSGILIDCRSGRADASLLDELMAWALAENPHDDPAEIEDGSP